MRKLNELGDPYDAYKTSVTGALIPKEMQADDILRSPKAQIGEAVCLQETQVVANACAHYRTENPLWELHMDNIAKSIKYFDVSIEHAKRSFVFSIVACSIGLGFLLTAILIAAFGQWQAAIIPTIGAVIAEFIAATVFWVHNKSANQLNRYYDSLHEIDVMVSAADMIENVSEEGRDKMYMKIIEELFAVQKIKAEKETITKRR
ncbi:MAG: hypothetical protein FWB76_02240 [Oscillospiraceae bacterium]|nr:hypothetical protein [Oscillospiraceae bacterium]